MFQKYTQSFDEISGIEKTKSIEENLDKEPFDFKRFQEKSRFYFRSIVQFTIIDGCRLFKMYMQCWIQICSML